MTPLETFPSKLRVAVIGASGGIGSALLRHFVDHDRVETVYAFSRTPCSIESAKTIPGELDLANEQSIASCAGLATPLDIVIVATGMLWSGDTISPEKTMRELNTEQLTRVFAVNAAGPAVVAKHFLPIMRKESKTVFAALSARVGSIGDNRLGGWYSYRASKAALNMLLKTLAIEHARLWPKSVVLGLHPGTVDTRLSSAYTKNTPPQNLFSPATAAGLLINLIDAVRPRDSGSVFAWDGKRIED